MENPFELILERLYRIENEIKELKDKINLSTTSENDIMDIIDVSNYLKISVPTIYGRVHRNTIPFYKNGKKLFFKKSDLEKYFFSNRNLTDKDIKDRVNEYLVCKGDI